ncbi:oxalyl-CoA decarboxylase [Acetobacter pomorum]|uniref:Oxalyl-CoA decarboxylase n=1 Tax=Acetobacter pomorum TaxID=65959 RepID=A0A2G4RE19_9PROT|nr:oxalyl-CoA decarboxylase [Acetobacter pomorum]PHY94812.1 oxalyl-CoA decarboxylase [Acetobacter pomorum]GBR46569.1 oxalyl-CoA decarboxylase [Acetobacter pomorum DSM 11825]
MTDQTAPSTLTDGFHLVIEALKLNNISTMFGVVGIPITDLARLSQAEGMRFISFRHEQPAGYAAAITGYLTKTPGVCLTTSAPGFLNGLVAAANANTNGFPMILISGSSNRAIVDLQQGDYEELDQMNAAKPFVKAAYRIDRPEDIGTGVARAIRTAVSGRPGVVYLDLPAAVLSATVDAQVGQASLIKVVDAAAPQRPTDEAIERAVSLLATAKHPLILLGKGAAYAQADSAIRDLIEKTGIPFLPMSMAKGLLPDGHPLSAASARSLALAQADVVLLIGARLNWMLAHGKAPQWSPTAKFIQIEANPSEFDSNRPISAPVPGDIGEAVKALNAAVASKGVKADPAWLAELNAKREQNVAKMTARLEKVTDPMNFFTALNVIKGVLEGRDYYLVNEGANTLDVTRNVIDMKLPRRRLDPGSWGTMGVGLGYAIGAAVTTGKPIVAIEGDSAFGFSGMEMETICRYKLPVVVIVFNNGGIYRGDDVNRGNGTDPGVTRLDASAHYEKIIEAFGGAGYDAQKPEDLKQALETALASGKPAMINCVIDPHVGTESGHLSKLNPQSAVKAPAAPSAAKAGK